MFLPTSITGGEGTSPLLPAKQLDDPPGQVLGITARAELREPFVTAVADSVATNARPTLAPAPLCWSAWGR